MQGCSVQLLAGYRLYRILRVPAVCPLPFQKRKAFIPPTATAQPRDCMKNLETYTVLRIRTYDAINFSGIKQQTGLQDSKLHLCVIRWRLFQFVEPLLSGLRSVRYH